MTPKIRAYAPEKTATPKRQPKRQPAIILARLPAIISTVIPLLAMDTVVRLAMRLAIGRTIDMAANKRKPKALHTPLPRK